jgi:cytochrome b subunit of formate dehydrogenase
MNIRILKGVVCAAFLLAGLICGSEGMRGIMAQKGSVKPGPAMGNGECLACHGDPQAVKEADGKSSSIYVNEATFGQSVHGSNDCVSCHVDIREYPHDPAPQKVSCATCHEGMAQEQAASIHASTRVGGKPAAGCVDCHGNHEIFRKDDHRSKVNRFKIAETCAGCHADEKVVRDYGMAPAQFIQNFRSSAHGKGMYDAGLSISATCSDCHGAHDVKAKSDPAAMISHSKLPQTCSKCHDGILNDFAKSTHGQLWQSGDTRGPNCATCHNSHNIRSTTLAGFQKEMLNQCAGCHAEQTETYRETFHGKATNLGMMTAAKCSDCHTAHSNLPASDPNSTVAPANIVATCSRCHTGVPASIASFNSHPEPNKKEKGAPVFYVYQFMKWLLLIVFAFFGIHTLLWFQRSVATWLGGKAKRHPEVGPYVTRFKAPYRFTHVVIVLSFLGLAFTGIPLHFSLTEWGGVFSSLIGGVEVARYFHRIWAIVTFGYAAYHLWFLLFRAGFKLSLASLFGPDSLAIRKQDLVDLYRNLRWFLYLGPQPKFDRWTYWEKFDYYAVFWGIPVIGLSGLVLWFPWFFTKFLPGWVLNVAMIVHGEEALLAVGFIFTFHFFHNHLRPENFPMDTVIFTGKMPLARFRDERPAEYERLVQEGRLDEVLCDPPTPFAQRLSFWFGLTALVIGLVIATAIFVTIIFF